MRNRVRRPSPWLSRGAVLAVIFLLLACAPETSHRVLSLFFDGVPDPGVPDTPPLTQTELLGRAGPVVRPPIEVEPFFASVHQPYADRACGQCHSSQHGNMLEEMDQTMCLRCHGVRLIREGWDHGPINFGICTDCHEPHASQFEHLQTQAQPELCVQCHDSPSLMVEIEEHRLSATGHRCTDCHDPHIRTVYQSPVTVGANQ